MADKKTLIKKARKGGGYGTIASPVGGGDAASTQAAAALNSQGEVAAAAAAADPPVGATPHHKANAEAVSAEEGSLSQQQEGEQRGKDGKDATPNLQDMEVMPGYENTGFSAASLPPPPAADQDNRGESPSRRQFRNAPSITKEQAREAMLQHVAEHCCYGKGPAQQMVFRDLRSSSAFHYTLETFAESRSTRWAQEPYEGQPIDGPERGQAPGPWDVKVKAPALFMAGKREMEVPHSAFVKPCHRCRSTGYEHCTGCRGLGLKPCFPCGGQGWSCHDEYRRPCGRCTGSGREQCGRCNGFGRVMCPVCKSHAHLKCFIKLTVTWENHRKDCVVERTALPERLIRSVTGRLAFQEENPRVRPIDHFPDQKVNKVSKSIVEKHARAFPTQRILMQRHNVRIVPVTQVFYSWKDQENASFFVYGFEHKVHAPDYPVQCCGCCVIL